jgi:hypothetical protein
MRPCVVIDEQSTCAFEWWGKGQQGPGGDVRFCAVKVTNGTHHTIRRLRINIAFTIGQSPEHEFTPSILSLSLTDEVGCRRFFVEPIDLEPEAFTWVVLVVYDPPDHPERFYLLKDLDSEKIELRPGSWQCAITVYDECWNNRASETFSGKLKPGAFPFFRQLRHSFLRRLFLDGSRSKPPEPKTIVVVRDQHKW